MQLVAQSKMNFAAFLISVLYVAGAGGISVKWGTSGGPIIPPTPAPPTPPPQPPFRVPAPAWEDNTADIPNPNPYRAPVFPQLGHYFPTRTPAVQTPSTPQPAATHQPISGHQPVAPPRYTHIVYNPKPQPPTSTTTLSPIKSFINAYAQPTKAPQTQNTQEKQNTDNGQQTKQEPYKPEPNYQSLESRSGNSYVSNQYQVPELGVKYVPGYGYKYFTAEQDQDPRKYDRSYKNDYHNKHNALETNDIFGERQHQNDLDLSYEKQMALRVKKSPTQQFYVPQQQVYQPMQYYHQPQFFFPANNYQRR